LQCLIICNFTPTVSLSTVTFIHWFYVLLVCGFIIIIIVHDVISSVVFAMWLMLYISKLFIAHKVPGGANVICRWSLGLCLLYQMIFVIVVFEKHCQDLGYRDLMNMRPFGVHCLDIFGLQYCAETLCKILLHAFNSVIFMQKDSTESCWLLQKLTAFFPVSTLRMYVCVILFRGFHELCSVHLHLVLLLVLSVDWY
jgi:uncharacterized membrane protein YhdT